MSTFKRRKERNNNANLFVTKKIFFNLFAFIYFVLQKSAENNGRGNNVHECI